MTTRARRWRRRGVAAIGVGATAWLGAAFALDRAGAVAAPPADTYDAIVVLGCGLEPDGDPSSALRARVTRAVELYQGGVAPRVVTTGGLGSLDISEADAAAALAQTLGVPSEAIVIERASTSTEENASGAAALLGSSSRVVVVSDRYHGFRAQRVFARHFAGAVAVGTIDPDTMNRSRGALREVPAVLLYAVRGRL